MFEYFFSSANMMSRAADWIAPPFTYLHMSIVKLPRPMYVLYDLLFLSLYVIERLIYNKR